MNFKLQLYWILLTNTRTVQLYVTCTPRHGRAALIYVKGAYGLHLQLSTISQVATHKSTTRYSYQQSKSHA